MENLSPDRWSEVTTICEFAAREGSTSPLARNFIHHDCRSYGHIQ